MNGFVKYDIATLEQWQREAMQQYRENGAKQCLDAHELMEDAIRHKRMVEGLQNAVGESNRPPPAYRYES